MNLRRAAMKASLVRSLTDRDTMVWQDVSCLNPLYVVRSRITSFEIVTVFLVVEDSSIDLIRVHLFVSSEPRVWETFGETFGDVPGEMIGVMNVEMLEEMIGEVMYKTCLIVSREVVPAVSVN